jgi:3-mercaptopyruvate sulfurtransferase SseA
METVGCDELKGMLDANEDIKLVFCMGQPEFTLKHIPGSLYIDRPPNISNIESIVKHDENIVVYCAGPDCLASAYAYEMMVRSGYSHVRRFIGGVYEWETEGLPLEGELVS